MSRDRFFSVMHFFHQSDNEQALPLNDPNHDRLFKIKPLLDFLVPAWQSAYYPGRKLSVDESIVALKGRCKFKVYKPNKHHKWGLNAWTLCDPKTGYAYN